MWWAGNPAVDLYLGTRWAAMDGGVKAPCCAPAGDFSEALSHAETWLRPLPPRSPVRVWLSGSQCRPFLWQPPPGLRGRSEIERVAAAMAAERTGMTPPVRTWIERQPSGRACVVVVAQDASLRSVEALVHGAGHRPVSLKPWWSAALSFAMREATGLESLAVFDGDALTIFAGQDAAMVEATVFTPVADLDSARGLLARARVALPEELGLAKCLMLSARGTDSPLVGVKSCAMGSFARWLV